MPRRLIDEIARLDQEEIEEKQTQPQLKTEPRVDVLHLEPDLDKYIELLEKRRVEILNQIKHLLHELREINEKLRKARQLQQLSRLK